MTEKEIYPLHPLTAFSTLDGRYWSQVNDLVPYASELALIKARFEVESIHMIEMSKVGAIRSLSDTEIDTLRDFGPNLTLEQGEIIKQIEDETDHDVKAPIGTGLDLAAVVPSPNWPLLL